MLYVCTNLSFNFFLTVKNLEQNMQTVLKIKQVTVIRDIFIKNYETNTKQTIINIFINLNNQVHKLM